MRKTDIVKFLLLHFLMICLILSNSNCNSNLTSNFGKNKRQEKKKIKRKLDEPDSIISCIKSRYVDEQQSFIFMDLKIYLDTLFLEDQIQQKGLTRYKESLSKSMKDAAEILESTLKIYKGWGYEIGDDTNNKITECGITKWNKNLIGQGVTSDNDMYEQGVSLIIMFKFEEENSMGNKIAKSKLIIQDFCDNPEVGVVSLNPDIDYTNLSSEYLTITLLQQFTHIIAFNENILDSVYMNILEKIDEKPDHYYLKTEKVLEFSKLYFGCDSNENGIEVVKDEDGNFHWSARYLLGDYMAEPSYTEEQAISKFTLAFFDDLGYLQVIKDYTGGLMRFGKNKGCDFLTTRCDVNTFENEFYFPPDSSISFNENSCSSGRQSKTVYKLTDYTDDLPANYIYFSSYPKKGGFLESAEYCIVAQSNSEVIYGSRCSNTKNTPNADRGESYSSTSFCAISSLVKSTNSNHETLSEVYDSVCFKMYCSEKSLTIQVGEDYLVCPREGGRIRGKDFDGYLLCPDYNLICTGSVMCNNLLDCLKAESQEKENTYKYKGSSGTDADDELLYEIKTSQIPTVYKTQEMKGWELSEGATCPKLCSQCDKNRKCVKCAPNYKVVSNNCVQKVENCKVYDEDENCQECIDEYVFVDGDNTACFKKDELGDQYFQDPDNINNYIKCSSKISNCKICEDLNLCNTCENGFGLTYDSSSCIEISKNEYYLDNGKYKPCSSAPDLTNCKKCKKNVLNVVNCLECDNEYALIHGESEKDVCKPKADYQNKEDMYSNDGGLNYYPCYNTLYHSVENCLNCENKESCQTCNTDYVVVNSNKLCVLSEDIENKKYYLDPSNNFYYLCAQKIRGCNKCENGNACLECDSEYFFDEYNKCVHSSLTILKYYLDPITGKYVSCTKIENCEECTSASQCTKCQDGYKFNNNKCEEIKEENDYNKIKALATAGVILGTLALIVAIFAVLLVLFKNKLFRPNNMHNLTEEINDVKVLNEPEEIVVSKKNKRSIHNEVKDEQ